VTQGSLEGGSVLLGSLRKAPLTEAIQVSKDNILESLAEKVGGDEGGEEGHRSQREGGCDEGQSEEILCGDGPLDFGTR